MEIIQEVIPNQRVDRIEVYLRCLAERLGTMERVERPESIDLIEDGIYQAARALSDERRRQLAVCVAQGITDRDREYLESKRILRLLSELDDAEIILLTSYLPKNLDDTDFWTRHRNVLEVPSADISSSRQELDRHTVYEAGRLQLLRLRLLQERSSGRSTSLDISPLGRLLLRRIGLAADEEV